MIKTWTPAYLRSQNVHVISLSVVVTTAATMLPDPHQAPVYSVISRPGRGRAQGAGQENSDYVDIDSVSGDARWIVDILSRDVFVLQLATRPVWTPPRRSTA